MKFCPVHCFQVRIFLLLITLITSFSLSAQSKDSAEFKTVIAGPQYDKSGFHQFFWGKHYRKDWNEPVLVRSLNLDTVNGGLEAYERGGGRQSKTLRLRNKAGKEYVLRSIDKSFGKALPDKYRGTFVENIIDDQVSIAQPFAAITIAPMAEAAGIYHTNPVIVFIPPQKALGEFSKDFENQLYLFEQRPDENWEEADNFGNAKKSVATEKMLENIWEDHDNRADQQAYVKARLFDMFIGDWGRHEDQWRWAVIEEDDKKLYKPIPRDRDQAYTKFDGALLSFGISAAGAGHLETFGPNIKNVATYNYPARNLDRQVMNETTRQAWTSIAVELKQRLTDKVIEDAVKQLPPAMFDNSGAKIISNLKARRDKLESFADDYYSFLARQVDITGTHGNELYSIQGNSNSEIEVNIYDLDKEGKPKKKAFYSRKFVAAETNELRIYGLNGNDQYEAKIPAGNNIVVRVIGGPQKDIYKGEGKLHVYDNDENDFSESRDMKKHLSSNPFVHLYNYSGFTYDKKGIGPIVSYNTDDHIHVGLKWGVEKQQWRKYPFGYKQELAVKYSISEAAFNFVYEGVFTKLIGNWNLLLNGEYDLVKWNNYFGIGNETKMLTEDRNYHRVRTTELLASIGLGRTFRLYHHARISGVYQTVKLLNDPGRFLTEQPYKPVVFTATPFAGAIANYIYEKVDDPAVPMKGFRFEATLSHLQNMKQSDSAVSKVSSVMNIYIPLSKSFVFSLKTGAATLRGEPEFYQLNKLSGSKTLRGFRKYRFYGTSMFYNQSELQFIRNVKTSLFNGKAGLIGFYDIGRVWQEGENSDTWHYGYGGGLMISPFNKFSAAVFYGMSRNERDFSIRFLKGL